MWVRKIITLIVHVVSLNPPPHHTHTHMYNHTHLQSYMALPKGGLVTEHVLVLPIGHYAASTDTPQVSWSIGLVYTVMIDEFLYIGSFRWDITVQECTEKLLQEQKAVLCHLREKFQISTLTATGIKGWSQILYLHCILYIVHVHVGNTPPRNRKRCSEASLLRPWTEYGHSTQWSATRHTHHWGTVESYYSMLYFYWSHLLWCCVQLAHPGVPYFIVEFDEGGSLFTRIKGRFPLQFGRYSV